MRRKNILTVFTAILCQFSVLAQTDQIDNKWLVVIAGFDNLDAAIESQSKIAFESKLLYSSEYDNLNPGWYINVVTHSSLKAAKAASKEINAQGYKSYVKYSGSNKKLPSYLLNNHFPVIGEQYIVLNTGISPSQLSTPMPYEETDQGAYIAKAKIRPSEIPDEINYLTGKEFIVYDIRGNKTIAKIEGFLATNISIPHWGNATQWREDNLSPTEISSQLLDMGELNLVAKISNAKGFRGVIAHMRSEKAMESKAIEADLRSTLKQLSRHPLVRECDSLLQAAMQEGGDYQHYEAPLIQIQTQSMQLDGKLLTFFNAVYGDYCNSQRYGHFYANIFAILNEENGQIEIVELVKEYPRFDFAPLALVLPEQTAVGFVASNYGGVQTFFKVSDWKKYAQLKIWLHECD